MKARAVELGIENDTSLYMCLSIKTESNAKFSLEYLTSNSDVKHIHLDTFEETVLKTGEVKVFEIEGYLDFVLKVMKKSGYPFILIKQCQAQELPKCYQSIIDDDEKGEQLVTKTKLFEG